MKASHDPEIAVALLVKFPRKTYGLGSAPAFIIWSATHSMFSELDLPHGAVARNCGEICHAAEESIFRSALRPPRHGCRQNDHKKNHANLSHVTLSDSGARTRTRFRVGEADTEPLFLGT